MALEDGMLPEADALPGFNVRSPFEIRAVELFVEKGSLLAVAKELGVPVGQLDKMSRQVWWVEEVRAIHRSQNAALDVKLTSILGKSLDRLEQALDEGEEYYDQNGNLHMRPVAAATLQKILTTVFDKRQIVRELPTNYDAMAGQSKLDALASKLEQLARAQQARTIDEKDLALPAEAGPGHSGGTPLQRTRKT